MYSYSPSSTNMKLPDIHGSIIAQIAIAQHIKVRNRLDVIDSGAFSGDVIKNAKAPKNIKQITVFRFHFTCFHSSIAETNINQTKKDQIKIGYFSIAFVIMFANNKKLHQIQKIKHNKKVPSIFFQKVFHLPVKNNFKLGTMFLIDWINLS